MRHAKSLILDYNPVTFDPYDFLRRKAKHPLQPMHVSPLSPDTSMVSQTTGREATSVITISSDSAPPSQMSDLPDLEDVGYQDFDLTMQPLATSPPLPSPQYSAQSPPYQQDLAAPPMLSTYSHLMQPASGNQTSDVLTLDSADTTLCSDIGPSASQLQRQDTASLSLHRHLEILSTRCRRTSMWLL